MKIFAVKHQHVTPKEITGDLVDFLADGHTKEEVKKIVETHANIKNALGEEVVDSLDDFLNAVDEEANTIVLMETAKEEKASTGSASVAEAEAAKVEEEEEKSL